MKYRGKIITVGINPCWDIFCRVDGLEWGEHKQISSQEFRPAGKALNVSRALAWMAVKSYAAGLWGRDDYPQMKQQMASLSRFVKTGFTVVEGRTRQNINIIDQKNNREVHLRSMSGLSSKKNLKNLYRDIDKIIGRDRICVFAGSPGEISFLPEVLRIVSRCRDRGAKVAVDSSGPMLKAIVHDGGVWLIKPNVEELGELLDEQLTDSPQTLIKAGESLLGQVEHILISRGEKGAILVTAEGSYQVRYQGKTRNVQSTVGCGDYLLAGFLKGWTQKGDARMALRTALKAGTAKAWGLSETTTWPKAERKIKTSTSSSVPGTCK